MGDPLNAHISVKNGPIMKILYFTESLLKFLNARSGLGPVFSPTGPVWVLNPDFQKNRVFYPSLVFMYLALKGRHKSGAIAPQILGFLHL